MEAIFVEITWKTGHATKAEAVEAARAIVRGAGHECGAFEEEQEIPGDDGTTSVVGNLECGESLYEAAEEADGTWERRAGVVTVSFETP